MCNFISACFDWKDNKPILKNETINFYNKFNDTMKCLKNNSHESEVCEKCMESYVQLDDYYKSLSIDSIGVNSVCMDIVDSVSYIINFACILCVCRFQFCFFFQQIYLDSGIPLKK